MDRRHHDPAVQRDRAGAGACCAVWPYGLRACRPGCSSWGGPTTTSPCSEQAPRSRPHSGCGPTPRGGRCCDEVQLVIWFVVRRLLSMVATLFVTSFLVFASLYLAPGDPLDFLMQGRSPTPEICGRGVRAVRARPTLPRPVLALADRGAAPRLRPIPAVPRGRRSPDRRRACRPRSGSSACQHCSSASSASRRGSSGRCGRGAPQTRRCSS